jgi:uncharacterized protein (DUF2062 family)
MSPCCKAGGGPGPLDPAALSARARALGPDVNGVGVDRRTSSRSGLTCLRAKVLPTTVSAAIVVGGLIGFFAAMPPFGVPLGLAVAAAGAWLLRSARTPAAVPSTT